MHVTAQLLVMPSGTGTCVSCRVEIIASAVVRCRTVGCDWAKQGGVRCQEAVGEVPPAGRTPETISGVNTTLSFVLLRCETKALLQAPSWHSERQIIAIQTKEEVTFFPSHVDSQNPITSYKMWK
jgi:hypothetical protein